MGIWTAFHKLADAFTAREEISELQAADMGISLSEARDFSTARRNTRSQMLQMARLFGLSERDVNRDRWRALDVARACSHCQDAKSCSSFLAGNWSTFTVADCPNANLYADLAKELRTAS